MGNENIIIIIIIMIIIIIIINITITITITITINININITITTNKITWALPRDDSGCTNTCVASKLSQFFPSGALVTVVKQIKRSIRGDPVDNVMQRAAQTGVEGTYMMLRDRGGCGQ